ncbi:PKD domain-containing protein [candidate division KSB1 bacterium]|nr:PKD domain-containing protein [candidate division KSB1 bacterium]
MMQRNAVFSILFFVLSMLLFLPAAHAQWSDEMVISEGSNPDLDVDWKTGDAYILSMLNGITITKIDMNGKIISQETVPGATGDAGGSSWGGGIAIGPNGEPHIMFRQFHGSLLYSGFYTYKQANGTWSSPLKIYERKYRGWTPRLDVDEQGRAHIAYGYGDDQTIHGDIYYRRVENGKITAQKDGISDYRADVNWELCATPDGEIHLINGRASYPVQGGPIYYYNSLDGGASWEGHGDVHHPNAQYANGFVDISDDGTKTFHFCYATEKDATINSPGIRYGQLRNNEKILDVLVTGRNEIAAEHLNLGLSSVAASEDGKYIMIAYITGQDGGDLCVRFSKDSGKTWSDREVLAKGINALEGRSRQFIRTFGHRFYLVYPYKGIKFRYYQIPGFEGPTAEANGPYSGPEGSPIEFTAVGSKDPDGLVMYAWDWNSDGIFDDSTANQTIRQTFNDDYTGTVTLRVRNTKGQMKTDVATITITNVAPIVKLGNDFSAKEGEKVNFQATVNDAGTEDKLTYQWNFGDGSQSDQPNPIHQFADNGTFTVKLTVQDDDGGETSDEQVVTVTNIAPTADAGGPYTGKPNEAVPVQATATDPGTGDVLTYTWDLDGDGTFETNGQKANALFAKNGNYSIKVKVVDDDGGNGTDEATVIIGSLAPKIASIPNQKINEGQNFNPIKLDSYVTDADDPVEKLTWTAEGNLQLEVNISNRVATITTPNADWYGEESIMFIANDPAGAADSAFVMFTVQSVNDPPVIKQIPAQTRNEGIPFQSIKLDNYVSDPDHNSEQLVWTHTGEANLVIKIENRIATVAPADSEWAGTENITFTATDPEGAKGESPVTFTIVAINDPPRIVNFPDQETIQFEKFLPVALDETVFDPDNADNELLWTFLGNNRLSVTITNRILTVESKDQNWFGFENITLIVTDPGNKQASKTVKFTVNKVDARPTIKKIQDQTIDEGMAFAPIHMDSFVVDKNNSPAQMTWSNFGQNKLTVKWNQRIATVQPPDKEWSGSETISFVVTDPDYLKDTTRVTFTVREINDPPIIAGVPDITFEEDTFYDIPISKLQQYTVDVDHDINLIEFGIKDSDKIFGKLTADKKYLHIYTVPHFCGEEIVTLFAKDPAGEMGTQPLKISVSPVDDPLQPFDIVRPLNESIFVWPAEKEFVWKKAIDPDPNATVDYHWILSRSQNFVDIFDQAYVNDDTVFQYKTNKTMWKGDYFWKVVAISNDKTTQETSFGKITTTVTDVDETKIKEIPKEFALLPNHPNPFNPETKITYQIPKEAVVNITVFNSLGQKVKELINEHKAPGTYEVIWHANDEFGRKVSSGIYVCYLKTEGYTQYIKMMLMQ